MSFLYLRPAESYYLLPGIVQLRPGNPHRQEQLMFRGQASHFVLMLFEHGSTGYHQKSRRYR
ncbi:MAG TPA: hypothetical protein VGL97_21980 [Bryobacteraceae bacterium]